MKISTSFLGRNVTYFAYTLTWTNYESIPIRFIRITFIKRSALIEYWGKFVPLKSK